MKTNHLIRLVFPIFGFIGFCVVGHAEDILPPSNAVVSIGISDQGTETAPVTRPAISSDPYVNDNPTRWNDIKDLPYGRRPDFFAGVKHLLVILEEQFNELVARKVAAKGVSDNQEFAIKQFEFSRSYLNSAKEEIGNAGPKTWSQQKARFGEAWKRTQDAYAKAIFSLNATGRVATRTN